MGCSFILQHDCYGESVLQPVKGVHFVSMLSSVDCDPLQPAHSQHSLVCCLQVANLAALGTGNKRYKCNVSDGAGSMEAVLGSEAAKLAAAGDLQEGAIFTMQDYVVNVINDAQKLVITGTDHALRIGTLQAPMEELIALN